MRAPMVPAPSTATLSMRFTLLTPPRRLVKLLHGGFVNGDHGEVALLGRDHNSWSFSSLGRFQRQQRDLRIDTKSSRQSERSQSAIDVQKCAFRFHQIG